MFTWLFFAPIVPVILLIPVWSLWYVASNVPFLYVYVIVLGSVYFILLLVYAFSSHRRLLLRLLALATASGVAFIVFFAVTDH